MCISSILKARHDHQWQVGKRTLVRHAGHGGSPLATNSSCASKIMCSWRAMPPIFSALLSGSAERLAESVSPERWPFDGLAGTRHLPGGF